MRYYIRRDRNSKAEGPFTIAMLSNAIQAGRIPSDALASSDLGTSAAKLQVWRSCDWFPIAAIGELRGVVPPLPEPTPQPHRVSVIGLVAYVAAALTFSYSAITERGWLVCVLYPSGGTI